MFSCGVGKHSRNFANLIWRGADAAVECGALIEPLPLFQGCPDVRTSERVRCLGRERGGGDFLDQVYHFVDHLGELHHFWSS